MNAIIKKYFDERWYLDYYPDVKNAGVEAFTHYIKFGISEGRLPCALPVLKDIRELWAAPHSTNNEALDRLRTYISGTGPNSAYALSNVAAYLHSLGDFYGVVDVVESNPKLVDEFASLLAENGLFIILLESYVRSEKIGKGDDMLALRSSLFSKYELQLAKATVADDRNTKFRHLNSIYHSTGLRSLICKTEESPYFNSISGQTFTALKNKVMSLACRWHKVTVIVPVYNASETIKTSILSLIHQSWINLEIIAIDDCSTDDTFSVLNEIAGTDSRITVLQNKDNLGAYKTRNRGLSAASGKFVTVMDADDWAHPQKIEKQVRPLIFSSKLVATVSHWARCTEDLVFTRLRPGNGWIHRNVSSLMVPTRIAFELGGWDNIKANADTEFYYRLTAKYGDNCIKEVMPGVPLSFGRVTESSLTRHSETHLVTQYGGTRKQYIDYARIWHMHSSELTLHRKSSTDGKPFPVPPALLKNSGSEEFGDNSIELERWQNALDESWYLLANKDVDMRGTGLHEHFWQQGEQEDRAPSPMFVPSAYSYSVLRESVSVKPTWHALKHGWDFNKPVQIDGSKESSGEHIVVCGHQVTSQLFGAERSLLDMLNALSEANYKITLILPSANNSEYINKCSEFVESIQFLPLPWYRKERAVSEKIIDYLVTFFSKANIKAVYVNTLVLHEPFLAAKKSKIKSVVHVRELPENDPDLMNILEESPAECRLRLQESCDYFIANSQETANWLGDTVKTRVVYNSVPIPGIVNPIPPTRIFNVCMISSNIRKKGVDDFFEVARLCEAKDNIIFNLYGPVTDEVRKAKKLLPLKNVKIHGYANDVSEAIQANHVVLSLSWFKESFGRTVAEAMLNERAVIGYKWGAIPELITEGTGILVEHRNTKAISEAIQTLEGDRDMLNMLAANARKSAKERLSPDIYNEKLSDIFSDILNKS